MACNFQNWEETPASSLPGLLSQMFVTVTGNWLAYSVSLSVSHLPLISHLIHDGNLGAQTCFMQPSFLLTLLGLIHSCVFPDVCFRGPDFNTAIALCLLVKQEGTPHLLLLTLQVNILYVINNWTRQSSFSFYKQGSRSRENLDYFDRIEQENDGTGVLCFALFVRDSHFWPFYFTWVLSGLWREKACFCC